MKYLTTIDSVKSDSETMQEGSQEPFEILKNHRQTILLRHQRKIKKQKKLCQKKRIQEQMNEDYRIRNEILNRNMLNDEQMWNMIADDSKISHSKQTCSGLTNEPTQLEIAKQFVHSLVVKEKKNIFVNSFEPFAINH